MFKVVIIDDEIYVASLIEMLIDWKALNMEIVGVAHDGLSALTLVEKCEPDIAIVDVRMPEYDGIEFMQKVRQYNKKIYFIVISGHKKFEYAKSAMQFNVEDYLLKPINKLELESILVKLKDKLLEEKQQKASMQELDNRLGMSKSKIRDNIAFQIYERKDKILNMQLHNLNETYFTHLKEGAFETLICILDSGNQEVHKTFVEKWILRMKAELFKFLEKETQEVLFVVDDNRLICYLNYDWEVSEMINQKIKKFLEYMVSMLGKFEHLYMTIGRGEKVKSLKEILRSHDKALESLAARKVLGLDRIIEPSHVKKDTGAIEIIFSDKERERLQFAIKSLDSEKISLQVKNLFSRADEYKYQNTQIYDEVKSYILSEFHDYICRTQIYNGDRMELKSSEWEYFRYVCNYREMSRGVNQYINDFIQRYVKEGERGESPAVRIAKRYIADNYRQNITLTEMAQIVHVSSVYFSILFKKEVGVNFSDYLNQFRIDISKKLLKDVQYNIGEVASMCGFQDSRYFSKVFKKSAGITPTSYRNRSI